MIEVRRLDPARESRSDYQRAGAFFSEKDRRESTSPWRDIAMITMLIVIVLIYRLIPARVRRVWSFGASTSHLVLADLRAWEGPGALAYFARCAKPRLGSKPDPAW